MQYSGFGMIFQPKRRILGAKHTPIYLMLFLQREMRNYFDENLLIFFEWRRTFFRKEFFAVNAAVVAAVVVFVHMGLKYIIIEQVKPLFCDWLYAFLDAHPINNHFRSF